MKLALGIWRQPKLAPIKPVIHSRRTMKGYSVENVAFESLPGFWVTGNLYRPLSEAGNGDPAKPHPAMLCPHGHWENARFFDAGKSTIRNLLATGEERFESAAQNHLQAGCVHLARMGCIVFHWDMIGYCDSTQISFDRAHRFAKQEPSIESNEQGWLLYSPQAETLGQSVMGLQAINTHQCVDFLLSMPEVDPQRIGITGASGGGTQSFIAAALDPRISLAFPAVMVSTAMQGGCTCENCCGLRVGTGNVEIAGLIAPRPLGMTAANDWTKDMATDGFPELKKLYEMHGAADRVGLFPSLHYGHNYNHVARVSMYGWVNKFFGLGHATPVLEEDFDCLFGKDLTIWNDQNPKPEGGLNFERKLLKSWAQEIRGAWREQLVSQNAEVRRAAAESLRSGWDSLLGKADVTLPASQTPAWRANDKHPGSELREFSWTSGNQDSKLRAIRRAGKASDQAWIVVSQWGANAALSPDRLKSLVPADSGGETPVIAVDLIGQASDWDRQTTTWSRQQALVSNPRLAAAYTFGYNPSVAVKSVHRLRDIVERIRQEGTGQVHVSGQGPGAFAAAALAFLADGQVGRLELDLVGSDMRAPESIKSIDFAPNSDQLLGIPGLLMAIDPQKTQIRVRVDGKEVSNLTDLLPRS
jgi:hypothetical protein